MTIEARYAASASGSSCIEIQAMYSEVNMEKFALTETAGYSACQQSGIGIANFMPTALGPKMHNVLYVGRML
jgi:hypothetical protein